MPLLATSDFPPPKNDKEFEEMVRDIFAAHWNDPDTKIFGRSGQKQNGVDIYGRPNQQDSWFGIQCKVRKTGNLPRKTLEHEIREAHSFHHKLHTYIFVTTHARDTELEKIVEKLDEIESSNGNFRVQIKFWDDVCSLLSENIRIARKYYPQYFKGWDYSESSNHQPLINHPTDITEASPMLVGLVIDFSRSMLRTLKESSGIRNDDLNEAFNLVVEKAASFCRTPEADEILPKFALFTYGYGFSNLRKNVSNIFGRLLNQPPESNYLIPTGSVRDLFAEVATKYSLPYTPDILVLTEEWDFYRKSVEYQFIDMGLGQSNFYESLCRVHNRLCKELEKPYFKHPLVIFISDGQIGDAEFADAVRITNQIKELGVQIMHCYVGNIDITSSKRFYAKPEEDWPQQVKHLFDLSSVFVESNPLLKNIAQEAKQKEWSVPEQARLFMQINHREMLEELIEILLASLKD